MLKVLDNEGEAVINLSDVDSKEDLEARIAKEDQELIEVLGDTPDWGAPLEGSWCEEDPPIDETTKTYAEWMTECLAWAREALGR